MADGLRIMHISTRLIIGGSQENTVLSCEGQVRNGHAVSLVYGPIYGPEGSMLERVQAFDGIEAIETPNLVRELAPMKDRRCLHDLRRLIRNWRPDVVHTHSSKAGILGRLAAWHEHVPAIIHTIHGLAFHRYQAKWRNAIYIFAERRAAKCCHRILGVADAMRDQALAAGIGNPSMYRTVYSGMEVERFLTPRVPRATMRERFGFGDDDVVVGTVSRLAELKGHDDLLDAVGPWLRDRPHVKLLWVGDGWWAERLLGRVASMGLAEQVVATGLVPPEEIPDHLHAMDFVVHPSYREGLPRVATQTLLSGRPVVAYDVDGTREIVIDRVTGRLLAPGDTAALSAAVEELVERPDLRAAWGAAGRAKCSAQFSAQRMVDELEVVYAEVLAESKRKSS